MVILSPIKRESKTAIAPYFCISMIYLLQSVLAFASPKHRITVLRIHAPIISNDLKGHLSTPTVYCRTAERLMVGVYLTKHSSTQESD